MSSSARAGACRSLTTRLPLDRTGATPPLGRAWIRPHCSQSGDSLGGQPPDNRPQHKGPSQLVLEELRAELAVDVGQDGGVQLQPLFRAAGKHVLFLLVGHLGLEGLGGRRLGRPTPRPVQLASFVGRVVRRAPHSGRAAPAVAIAACTLGPGRSTLLQHQCCQVALALLAHTFRAPSGAGTQLVCTSRLAVRKELVATRAALARHRNLLFTFRAMFGNHPVLGHARYALQISRPFAKEPLQLPSIRLQVANTILRAAACQIHYKRFPKSSACCT